MESLEEVTPISKKAMETICSFLAEHYDNGHNPKTCMCVGISCNNPGCELWWNMILTQHTREQILDHLGHSPTVGLALAMYANEPCRICGEPITLEQVETAVFAGYSLDNTSRSAHKECWDTHPPKEEWAYPHDSH